MKKIYVSLLCAIFGLSSLFINGVPVQGQQGAEEEPRLPEVYISEVNWSGSALSTADEWIEIANRTSESVDIGGWTIHGAARSRGSLVLPEEMIIEPFSVVLISNYASGHEKSTLDVVSDYVTSNLILPNSNLQLELVNGNDDLVDSVDFGSNTPDAGSTTPFTSAIRTLEGFVTAEKSMNLLDAEQMGTPGIYDELILYEDPAEEFNFSYQRIETDAGCMAVVLNTEEDLSPEEIEAIGNMIASGDSLSDEVTTEDDGVEDVNDEANEGVGDVLDGEDMDGENVMDEVEDDESQADEGGVDEATNEVICTCEVNEDMGHDNVGNHSDEQESSEEDEVEVNEDASNDTDTENDYVSDLDNDVNEESENGGEQVENGGEDASSNEDNDSDESADNGLLTKTFTINVPPGILGQQIAFVDGYQLYLHNSDWPSLKVGDKVQVQGETGTARGEDRFRIRIGTEIKVLGNDEVEFVELSDVDSVAEMQGMLVVAEGEITDRNARIVTINTDIGEVRVRIHSSIDMTASRIASDSVIVKGVLRLNDNGVELYPLELAHIIEVHDEVENESSTHEAETSEEVFGSENSEVINDQDAVDNDPDTASADQNESMSETSSSSSESGTSSTGGLLTKTFTINVPPGILGQQIAFVDGYQLYLHNSDWPSLKVGDRVQVQGETGTARGEDRFRIRIGTEIKVLGNDEVEFVELSELMKRDVKQGALVSASGVITHRDGRVFNLSTSNGDIMIRLHTSLGLTARAIESDHVTVRGVFRSSDNGLEIHPTSVEDIKPFDLESPDSEGAEDVQGEQTELIMGDNEGVEVAYDSENKLPVAGIGLFTGSLGAIGYWFKKSLNKLT